MECARLSVTCSGQSQEHRLPLRPATTVEVENNVDGSVVVGSVAVLTNAQLRSDHTLSGGGDGQDAQSSSNGRKGIRLRRMEQKGVVAVLTELLGTSFCGKTYTADMLQKWIKG